MRNTDIKIAIILLILVFGCKSKPDGLIDTQKMSVIIADLKMLEAKVDNFGVRDIDSSRVAYKHLEKKLIESHNLDTTTYFNSYNYYLKNKKKLSKILEKSEQILEEKLNNQNEKLLLKE